MLKKTKSTGFTLVELMIVISIIGMITAAAIPQYHTYSNRTFVTNEGLNAARVAQLAITEFASTNQRLPLSASEVAILSSGETPTIQSVTISSDGNANITILFKSTTNDVPSRIASRELVLTPTIQPTHNAITWNVNSTLTTIENSYWPKM